VPVSPIRDHNLLINLAVGDPHPQYLNTARGDARYALAAHNHAGVYQPVGSYQTQDAELTALAGLTSAADRLPYFTGSGTADLATFTAAGRSLVGGANAAAMRATLELGTAATEAETAFARLLGRAGGQTLNGDTASAGNIRVDSTSHATKGNINLNGTSTFVGPDGKISIFGGSSVDQLRIGNTTNHYRIGRDTGTGYLGFTGTQTGFTGYTFDGPLVLNGGFQLANDKTMGWATASFSLHLGKISTFQNILMYANNAIEFEDTFHYIKKNTDLKTEIAGSSNGVLLVGRVFQGMPATAPTDAAIAASQMSPWYDETSNLLTIRIRKSDGTYVTKTL
jgi:hypothetical protein